MHFVYFNLNREGNKMAEKDDIQQHCFRLSQEKALVLRHSLTDVFFLCHSLRRILSRLVHSVTRVFSHLCHPLTSGARSGEPVTVKPLCHWIPDPASLVGNDGSVGGRE